MNKYDCDCLRGTLDELMGNFNEIVEIVRREDKHLYERWKAGGLAVSSEFLSMYPAIEEVVETLLDGQNDCCPGCGEELKTRMVTGNDGHTLEEEQYCPDCDEDE